MTADTLLILVGGIAVIALIITLFRKGSISVLPVFFWYLVFEFFLGLADYSVKFLLSKNAYLLFWSITAYIDLVFYCAVILEIGRNLLRHEKDSSAQSTLAIAVFFLTCFGLSHLIDWKLSPRPFLWLLSTYTIEITALVQLAAFLTLAVWSSLNRFHWPRSEFRVASGLGFFSLVAFIVGIAYSNPSVHGPRYIWVAYLTPIAGVCVYLYWLQYFSFEGPPSAARNRSAELVAAGRSDDDAHPGHSDSAAAVRL